ncbi:MAG: radical SAM protein [Candidatus Aminicenantes bacterium]|nr:radical SAM protein [Candidatus Aminicenantes bacterium]
MKEARRFVYGPVPSRRLGFSLGVDILPFKSCTLDCVYCQLGRTPRTTDRRRSWFPAKDVLAQVRGALGSGQRIDAVTFSGSGEPTLNKDLGRLIREIKKMTRIPVVVLTNGTLLSRKDVRDDLAAADIVVPSLDAATAARFRRVNRPHPSLRADKVLDGLVAFRKGFAGRIWLEIMLVKGTNDSPADLRALKRAADRIRPDRIHLNTVVRPPAEVRAKPLSPAELRRIRGLFGPRAEVIASFEKKGQVAAPAGLEEDVLATVGRRPVTADDIAASLGRHRDEVLKTLARLLGRRRVRAVAHRGRTFYRAAEAAGPEPLL